MVGNSSDARLQIATNRIKGCHRSLLKTFFCDCIGSCLGLFVRSLRVSFSSSSMFVRPLSVFPPRPSSHLGNDGLVRVQELGVHGVVSHIGIPDERHRTKAAAEGRERGGNSLRRSTSKGGSQHTQRMIF